MARGYANVQFEWNNTHSVIIRNKGFGKGLNQDAAEIIYQTYYPFIPYSEQKSSGSLANRVRITSYESHANITHMVPYANRQFNADAGNANGTDVMVHRTRTIHPLATSHWSDWAWSVYKKDITRQVDEARLQYTQPTEPSGSVKASTRRRRRKRGLLQAIIALVTGDIK